MKENLRQAPIEDPRKSQRGEIKVGDAGAIGFIVGLLVLNDGVNNHSEPQIIVGGAISLAILLEAVTVSLISTIRNPQGKK